MKVRGQVSKKQTILQLNIKYIKPILILGSSGHSVNNQHMTEGHLFIL